jgi:hypothetical protein
MSPLSSFTRRFTGPVCDALSVSGPAVLITIVDGRYELNKLLSCLRYASVYVSNKDSRVTKPLDFVFVSHAVMILVDAGIATPIESCSVFSTICFQIIVSVFGNMLNFLTPLFANMRAMIESFLE